jgi:hypothetical protein
MSNMKQVILLHYFMFIALIGFTQQMQVIRAEQLDPSDDYYREDLPGYTDDAYWAEWSGKLGKALATSTLAAQIKNNYAINNLQDFNLNTAWIEGDQEYGIGEQFGFVLDFGDGHFGDVYQFYGRINVFNGYCKSVDTWQKNSRIRKLKVSYNDTPLCIVELLDTWQYQYFHLGEYFKQTNPIANIHVKQGDKLSFEIMEVYPGSLYKDVAVSIFMFQARGN